MCPSRLFAQVNPPGGRRERFSAVLGAVRKIHPPGVRNGDLPSPYLTFCFSRKQSIDSNSRAIMTLLHLHLYVTGLVFWITQKSSSLVLPNATELLQPPDGGATGLVPGIGVPRSRRRRYISPRDMSAILDYHNQSILSCKSHSLQRYRSLVDLVKSWHYEKQHYSFPHPRECRPRCPSKCSASMVWASSNRLGCAVNTCANVRVWGSTWRRAVLLVCNYAVKAVVIPPLPSGDGSNAHVLRLPRKGKGLALAPSCATWGSLSPTAGMRPLETRSHSCDGFSSGPQPRKGAQLHSVVLRRRGRGCLRHRQPDSTPPRHRFASGPKMPPCTAPWCGCVRTRCMSVGTAPFRGSDGDGRSLLLDAPVSPAAGVAGPHGAKRGAECYSRAGEIRRLQNA
nr:PREDICTED: peptidase inhibitor R3HDML [Struthio camelus australis]